MKVVKSWIATIGLLSFAGLAWAAPDELDDAYSNLKEATTKKDLEQVQKWSAETSKLARAFVAAPQPADADAKAYKERLEFAKEVDAYSEYSLGFMATQGLEPAKVIHVVDSLIAQNPKSKYLDLCSGVYIATLGKQGGLAKQLEGAAKIVAGRPDQEEALLTLVEGYANKSPDRALGYANKLTSVMKAKPKPEGVPEADWERKKSMMLGHGYYYAGVIEGNKSAWVDCDRNLRAALPLISKDQALLGTAYFYLGLSNYQLGKMTNDRTKIHAAQQYSEQSSKIPGPMQQQAFRNSMAMKQELGAPVVRR